MPSAGPGPGPGPAAHADAASAAGRLELELSEPPFPFASSPLEEETQQMSGDGDEQESGRLERRWTLWHEFMKEHAHLDAWLRLAEQAVTSHNSAPVTYVAAKEALRTFERFDAGSRLVQLDGLTRRNRTLAQLFHGAMRARLLGAARECGRRWDDVNAKLDSIVRRLMVFVSEWEEFEAEGEELSVWLAELDVRLSEVDQRSGSACEKLRRLQALQDCVCVNSSRINALLQRGEALIQSSQASDARHLESRLLELLRRCSHIYNSIARTHTRLLSMRLVFEDHWLLSQDSGCPSETLLEEPLPDGCGRDPPLTVKTGWFNGYGPVPSLSPPSSTHDPQGLEWDPSVDVGCSVSCDDADSSYFSAGTGVCHRDRLKRRRYLSSLGSESDISTDLGPEGRSDLVHPGVFSPAARHGGDPPPGDPWRTRVRAWLSVHSPASCSKAVQTEGEVQAEEESSFCEESKPLLLERRAAAFLLFLCGAAAVLVLASLAWVDLEPPCHRSNRMHRSVHLVLRYINGPPPT
ncbi:nesprin-2 isoform X2 [Betta splendens]|nr:nesprin-2 isoform X2 [Betta splendens]